MTMASSSGIYTDFSALTELKARAGRDREEALDEVVEQFESLFVHMMLKSMRQAKLADGMFDSNTMKQYRDMYDQQLAVHLSGNGGLGLADVLKRQLSPSQVPALANRNVTDYRNTPVQQISMSASTVATKGTDQSDELHARTEQSFPQHRTDKKPRAANQSVHDKNIVLDGTPETFVEKLWPFAQRAAAAIGLQPEALLAQAALETGWGKHVMNLADGSSSHNLFGIKADYRWQGKQADISTLEYRQGIAVRERAYFRAYDSYAEAFDDYADFIASNQRYQHAVNQSNDPHQYFHELQNAGYATDPAYAKKILSVLERGDIQEIRQRIINGGQQSI